MANEAECRKVLHSVYEIRRNENRPDDEEIMKIEHGLSMIHFLSNDFEKVDRYTNILMEKPEVTDIIKTQLKRVIDFINRDKN